MIAKISRILLLIVAISLAIGSHGQHKIRPLLWFGPSDDVAVYGVNVAPLMFKLPENSVVNGINIEGIGVPFLLYMIPVDPTEKADSLAVGNDFIVNGINISAAGIFQHGTVSGIAATPFYTYIDRVNGAQLSIIFNISYRQNGLCVSLNNSTLDMNGLQIGLFNRAKRTKGVQIGAVNRTNQLKGLQIGLWNINEKRKLPIINW